MREDCLDRLLEAITSKTTLLYGSESSGKTKLASIIAKQISCSGGKVIYAFNSLFNRESFVSALPENFENILLVGFEKFSSVIPLLLRAAASGYVMLIVDEVTSSERQNLCELSLLVALLSEVVRRFNRSLLIVTDESPEGGPIFHKLFLRYVDETLHVQRYDEELKIQLPEEELSLPFRDLLSGEGRIV